MGLEAPSIPRAARRVVGSALALAVLAAAIPDAAPATCGSQPWCDRSLAPGTRAALLYEAMTPQERISLLAGDELLVTVLGNGDPDTHIGVSEGIPRLGVPTMHYTDGPTGVRQGPGTAMPSSLALAATWKPKLAFRAGRAVGVEAKLKGNDVVFGPNADMMRTPYWGRTFETLGEDPFLARRFPASWARGLQSTGVIADAKHFTGNHQDGQGPAILPGAPLTGTVGGRFLVNSLIDERTLREVYLPPFEAAVKRGNVGTVMCAYSRVNGTYACINRHLIERILKDDWKFKGYVLTDYPALYLFTAQGLRNGADFEPWSGLAYSTPLVSAALATGLAASSDVREHVIRILRTMFEFGVFDREPYRNDPSRIDFERHARVSERVERRAITLLRNRKLLPLDRRRLDSVAVIGADAARIVAGGGSSAVEPISEVTPLAAIEAEGGRALDIRFHPGDDPSAAAALAAEADLALVFVSQEMTEGVDVECISLDCEGRQDALIEAVARANPRTAVVMQTGGPVLTPWRKRVGAILEAWYPGSAGGRAIARVLFGRSDPGGRTPVTFPRSESDLPTAGKRHSYPGVGFEVRYDEGVFGGYRWFDQRRIGPAFAFGHGLSYTRFRLRDLRVRRRSVSVVVENVGARKGIAVPQLYLGMPGAPGVAQPPRWLKGYRSVRLRPGEARRVRFPLDRRSFAHWSERDRRWRVTPGCYRVFAGRSSRRLPLRGSLSIGTPKNACR